MKTSEAAGGVGIYYALKVDYEKGVLTMLRKIFASAAAVILVSVGAMAQETSLAGERSEGEAQAVPYDYRLSFHQVSIGYGVLSINDITSITSDLFPSLAGTQLAERWGTGSVNLGYTYRLTPAISVGGMFAYSGNMSDVVGRKGAYIYKNFYSILPQVKFEWYHSGLITLYSRLAAGVVIANIQDQSGTLVENAFTAAAFTFQVSPIGLEIGRSVSGFVEAGFGATGVLTFGVRKNF